jgi:uncharacterized caspase-like protein
MGAIRLLHAWRLTVAIAVAVFIATAASANESRPMRGVALIIGNSAYEHLTPLANPEADADAIENLFDELGFETYDATDADLKKLRRTIDRFIEDAEGVDVALIYYAGHGVEAGGENYLVPVDADVSSLDEAAEKLVPLGDIMRRLREAAPLSFVLLDACRDNPFPPGSTIRVAAGAAPLPVAASGLGETRTMGQFNTSGARTAGAPTNDSLGTLISFAAEPGQRALDGEPGGNSPYAAAVLRHVPAMAGEEISTVMRMVAEEVYLKTGGKQRPWINENLRRLVYLGTTPPEVEGAEGDILRERRQLLINIAALPSTERKTIEAVARDGGVTMDSVYGMLRALGGDAPKDPAELKKLLAEQIARIKQLESERAAIASTDPEIARLAALADQAAAEGAVETALRLHEQAKARVEEISAAIDDAEENIKARRLEFADVYARSAQANYAAFKFQQAARDYEKAFNEVERWDDYLTWSYRGNQAESLYQSGWRNGVTDDLRTSADLAVEVIALSDKLPDRADWALSQRFLGNTLMTLGQRIDDQATIARAISAYEAALTVYDGENQNPFDRLSTKQDLVGSIKQVAQRYEPARAKQELRKAIALYDELLVEMPKSSNALEWARIAEDKAATLNDLARLEQNVSMLREAISLLGEISEINDSGQFLDDAEAICISAIAWSDLGVLTKDRSALDKSEAQFERCVSLSDRNKQPIRYTDRIGDRALNLHHIFANTDDPVWLERAIPLMREVHDMADPVARKSAWLHATTSLAGAQLDLGRTRKDSVQIEQSLQLYESAWQAIDRSADPPKWADMLSRVANARRLLGEVDPARANNALVLEEFEQAMATVGLERYPDTLVDISRRLSWVATPQAGPERESTLDRVMAVLHRAEKIAEQSADKGSVAFVQFQIGRALAQRAIDANNDAGLEDAISYYRRSLVPEAKNPGVDTWRIAQSNIALALARLAGDENREMLKQAIEPYREAIAAAANDREAAPDRRRLAELFNKLAATNDPADLRQSVSAWRDLVAHAGEDPSPEYVNYDQQGLAIALANLAENSPGDARDAIPEAISHYRAVLARLKAASNAAAEQTTRNLVLALQQWQKLKPDRSTFDEIDRLNRDLAAFSHAADVKAAQEAVANAAAFLTNDAAADDKVAAAHKAVIAGDPSALPAGVEWSRVQEFGQALYQLGSLNTDPASVRRGAEVLNALLAWPSDRLPPEELVTVRANLGNALLYLGDLASDPGALADAITQFGEVTKANAAMSPPASNEWATERLAVSNLVLGEITGKPENWREGVALMRQAYAAAADSTFDSVIAQNAGNLAFAISRAVRAGVAEPQAISEALTLGQKAVDATSNLPGERHYAQLALCAAQIEDGRIKSDRTIVEQGLALCRAAVAAIKATSHVASAERAQKNVAYAEDLLKKM